MRLDNPIYNHKFKNLPDIAEYAEVKDEYKNNRKVDLTKLYGYLKKRNLDKFNFELDKIIEDTYSDIPLNKAESKETLKWRTYLNKYFLYYEKFKAKSKIIKNNND